jgi:hypothetical protein
MDLALHYCGQTILSSPFTRGFPGQHRRFAPPGVVGSTRFFAARASLAFGRSASGVFVPERAPLWEFILTRDLSRVLTLRTFRLVGPPAPSQALTSPVAPNGHRRAFRTRRRAPCRDSIRAAWLPPRPEPLPRMPFKATSSRFRTPSIGSIPTSRPETVTRMNNWRRTSKQPGHPSCDRQLPGPSRLVGRHSSLLPVVTYGTSRRRRPSGRRHLSPISATKPSCQIGHPVKPPVSGTGSGLRRSDQRFRALPCHPQRMCELWSNTVDVDAG